MPCCPFCSSDMVYPLLNTLRCKRCKNIWKEGEENPGRPAACGSEGTSLRIRKKTDPLETRMKRKLDEYLTRSKGKFCFSAMPWQAGDISQELFMRYLKRCVKDRSLAEEKDRYGRTWYLRP
ncbi:hypothetical protein [uncultured Methanoregula sp.]|uniref:hypothetical protein n=1 Tax=uncultured Methanoregula sp. TaxID=1005933 RepID=UPI002AAC0619|nr:hypothetical protein [uncultured Methanoregula sp.]